jgi:uncharacterized protein (TIGR02118 family)
MAGARAGPAPGADATETREENMIKVSVLYPRGEKSRFDMDYYCAKHIPMVINKLGAALKRTEVDEGMAGGAPNSPAPFVGAAHLYFDSVESFQGAFGPHAKEIMADVPNYTDIQPTMQISQVRM